MPTTIGEKTSDDEWLRGGNPGLPFAGVIQDVGFGAALEVFPA